MTESTEQTSSASNGSSGSETKKRTLSDVAMPDPEPETSAFAESAEHAQVTTQGLVEKEKEDKEEMVQVFESEEEQNQAMIQHILA